MTGSERSNNIVVRKATKNDEKFWFSLDKHLSRAEFDKKVRDGQGYVLAVDGEPVGILRYNLFWDEIPFCTLLFIDERSRHCGYGALLLRAWENEVAIDGHGFALTSTRSDESAQNFYRACGYVDCGALDVPDQPIELFLKKSLNNRK